MINIIRSVVSIILAIVIFATPVSTKTDEATHEIESSETVIQKQDEVIAATSSLQTLIKTAIMHLPTFPQTNTSEQNDNQANHTDDQSAEHNKPSEVSHNEPKPTKPQENNNPSNESTKPSTNPKPEDQNQPTKPNDSSPESGNNNKPTQDSQHDSENETAADDNRNDDGSYDGDTAVPDDVYAQPTKCTTHELTLKETNVDNAYELVSYVTKIYKCTKCNYSESSIELSSNNLSQSELRAISNRIVSKVNDLRQSNGLCALSTDSAWNNWADMRAKELSQSYGHSRPNGQSWMTAIGSSYTIAENIASGQTSGSSFFNAFKNSSQHKSNMLCKDATAIAVGIYVNSSGTTYCAMIIIAQ